MINFRYHLVSLIAVFLALAVGVVLGAGPLQNAVNIAAQGGGSKDSAVTQQTVDELRAQVDQGDIYSQAVGEQLLAGSLKGEATTVVVMSPRDEQAIDRVTEVLETMEADVVGQVELTADWASIDQAKYRATLSAAVSGNLSERPEDATDASVLGQALVEVITTQGANADLLKEILSDERTPLVDAQTWPDEKADRLVIVGPKPDAVGPQEQENAQSGDASERHESWVGIAQAAATEPGAVALGHAQREGEFIAVVRQAETGLTTVDQADSEMGATNLGLALMTGEQGQFGQGLGAERAVPPFISWVRAHNEN